MPSVVRGYHGTILPDAQKIVDNRQIDKRIAPYHWLGQGIYFWEDAPLRAWEWALTRSRQERELPAVVSAFVVLRNCLDFLDIASWPYVRGAHTLLEQECAIHGPSSTPMPRQQPSFYIDYFNPMHRNRLGRYIPEPTLRQNFNYLDCEVVERAVLLAEHRSQAMVKSVRAAFLEGRQLYGNSYFFDRNHVQIAVRDPHMISDLIIEPDDELRRRFGNTINP